MNLIEVKNISKSFDDLLVLDNVSLNVQKGECVVIVGPSGVGKSSRALPTRGAPGRAALPAPGSSA